MAASADIDALVVRRRRTGLAWVGGAALLLALTAFVDLLVGPAMLEPAQVLRGLVSGDDARLRLIVHEIRLPKVLMAVVVGMGLAIAGAQMQTTLNNPLASPYTLGLAAAAGVGAASGILFGAQLPLPQAVVVPVTAFLGCATATLAVYGVARLHGANPLTMILAGIALMFLFQSLQALLQFRASPEALQQMVFWLFGSLQKASWERVGLCAAVIALVLPWLLRDAWRLTALSLGDEYARGLGVDVAALRRRVFLLASILTAVSVAFVGTIGFIGLVAPHIARMLVGAEQRFFLPLAALCGAIMLSGASILSKVIAPGAVFPIGIVTAFVGVPFFLYLILAGRGR